MIHRVIVFAVAAALFGAVAADVVDDATMRGIAVGAAWMLVGLTLMFRAGG